MNNTIYFVDIKCKQPYTFSTMAERAIGGTESTLLRVADRLSEDYRVFLVQPCREQEEMNERGISYLSLDTARQRAAESPPAHVIVIRKIKVMSDMASWFPEAKLYLWIQDLPVKKYCRYRHQLIKHNVTMICNTHWQRSEAERYLSPDCWYQRLFHPLSRRRLVKMAVIYNVINPEIRYEPVEIDEDKLVFFRDNSDRLGQLVNVQINKTNPWSLEGIIEAIST